MLLPTIVAVIPRPPVVVPRRPHAANDGPTSRDALGPGLAQRTRRGRAAAGDGGHEGRAGHDATLGSSDSANHGIF